MTNAEFHSIFEANKDAIYGFAWRMTGSQDIAEDIAQDCFLQLLKSPAQYAGARGPIRAWLLGIARNLILKRWRVEGRGRSVSAAADAARSGDTACACGSTTLASAEMAHLGRDSPAHGIPPQFERSRGRFVFEAGLVLDGQTRAGRAITAAARAYNLYVVHQPRKVDSFGMSAGPLPHLAR